MASVLEYLEWRGDVPFSAAPLNDVDSYILCKIGTLDWSGIVPEDNTYIRVGEAAATYFANGGAVRPGVLASPMIAPAVKALGSTVRFGDIELTGFCRKVNDEETEQFSALTLRLPDGRHFITFRGTDDSIVGWKENCLLAVRETVPAQRDAAAYLCEAAERYAGTLLVGGHSKGGNLAVYAAATAPEAVRERVESVWNFDGPGFGKPLLESEGYQMIRPRLRTILPQHALVGTLLTQEDECCIVKSSASGMAAHDGFQWETTPRGFVPCSGFARTSRAFDKAMDAVISDMSREEREAFIEDFFGTLTSSGAETLTDLTEQNVRQSLAMVRMLHRESEIPGTVAALLENMAKNYVSQRRKRIRKYK